MAENSLILNIYEIFANNDFHIVLYYVSEYICHVIIRRLDEETGWDSEIFIKIYSNDNSTFQVLSLGISEENCKKCDITTLIPLYPTIYINQIIPKRIVQTYYDNSYKSILHYNAVQTFKELNPEYEYDFYDDIKCRQFIKDNFATNILDAYDILNPGAYKADLFRLCYIYINGGCYFDHKYILRMPLHKVIRSDDNNLFCKDKEPNMLFNSIIMSIKNSSAILRCINNIVKNVQTKYYGKCPLHPTGPILLYKHCSRENICLIHDVSGKNYTDSKVFFGKHVFLNTHYKNYYGNEYNKNSYSTIFKKREIYYQNMYKTENYIFLVYPNIYNDKFVFYHMKDDDKFKIKRVDKNEGWGQDLKIKVINNDTNISSVLEIGSSECNEKIFIPFVISQII